ncbi:class I SAM-dependent methyltransferase [Variovorax sp. J22G21]|uniref:class I SAM-dependent methyltransferase n=1 Tax=Variovorax fucosicus TaxID=3053517 RepID=UPI0025750087|nr:MULTISPECIES: class I SAM-dependent methyltransferase [unclassified Variovorax]MDM0039467.1 class I SAM-dependent methyltransferase [Variovorax sp. J22R193]MDM0064242.1 class I SAM-dependent methyltransferase [Variovorax sp. J22G21]
MIQRFIQSLKRINPLAEPLIRHFWVYLRALYFIRIAKRLRTLDSGDALKANVSHNMRSIYGANHRMNLLLFPLAIIETLDADSRILVIGPRNEFDLYSLVALGFRMKNLVGLDLISYSPHIVLGDMHRIPFDDCAFDAVVCGWTLSYSTKPQQAALEMIRVTRPGGIIAIGVEYSNLGPVEEKKLLGYQLQEFDKLEKRINSSASIKLLFDGKVDHVYFEHDAPRKISHSADGLSKNVSNVAVVFSRAPIET